MIYSASCIIFNSRNIQWADSDLNLSLIRATSGVLPEANLCFNPFLTGRLHWWQIWGCSRSWCSRHVPAMDSRERIFLHTAAGPCAASLPSPQPEHMYVSESLRWMSGGFSLAACTVLHGSPRLLTSKPELKGIERNFLKDAHFCVAANDPSISTSVFSFFFPITSCSFL